MANKDRQNNQSAHHDELSLESLQTENENQEKITTALLASGDDITRQKIAKKFVNFYFSIMILIIVGVPVYNVLMFSADRPILVISIKDAILTYSAVAGPTFGLVVAYYFKSKNDQ